MIKAGYATVYDGGGAEYGEIEKELRQAEIIARKNYKGMWKQLKDSSYQSPAEYKKEIKKI